MRKKRPDFKAMQIDYEVCIKALVKADFNRTKAAIILNITRRTLYNKMKRFKEAGLHKTDPVA